MNFDELYVDSLSSVARAVQSHNFQLLQELLQDGHPSTMPDNRGWTPLHLVASEGCVEGARLLLLADDVQVDSLSHGGLSPLYLACLGNTDSHSKVVELLLSAGADPDMGSGDTWDVPLHTAIEKNHLAAVRMLLEAGADPNIEAFKNTSALHAAAETGSVEVAQLLLDKGGNLNLSGPAVEHSALHMLCLNYRTRLSDHYNTLLDLFLEHGSQVNAQTKDGESALMLAVQARWGRAVDRLLQHGADVALRNNDNILALHFAIQFCPEPQDNREAGDGAEGGEDTSVLKKILSRMSHDKIPRDGSFFSIFHLAIHWERYQVYAGLRVLLEDGLQPDEFLQEMGSAVIDCDETCAVPLIVEIGTTHDTPLGFLLSTSLSREVVDVAKYMIDKGSSVNSLGPGVLPPLVAALKNRHPQAYEAGGLGQELLHYLLSNGAQVMHKMREEDVLPSALMVSSLFNVVGFFRLLQFGVPVHRVYTHHTLTALLHHYQAERVYRAHKLFPWLVVSWVGTANLFTAQLPPDTTDIFNIDWNVPDENIAQAWQDLETVIASPKSLQQLCVLVVRLELGEAKGWDKLQASLKKLQAHTRLPEPILDLLHFRWVETSALQLSPPASARHLYVTEHVSASSASSDEDP